jgi:1,4-dihydroxy-2-naphthoyl-CoA synthase
MIAPPYFDKDDNLAFERDADGVLVLRFHTDTGPVVFTGQLHEDLPAALEDIALDPGNTALVLTGTGDAFIDRIDGASLGEIFRPAVWEKIRVEGAKVLQRLIELPMPVVGVANGPATVHAEYLLLSDIHIASDRATYADTPHERAVERGVEIARRLAKKPALYRSLQKQTLNLNMRRRIVQDVPFGMALEGLTAADLAYQAKP